MPDVYELPAVAEYVFREDFSGNGDYSGANDDISEYVLGDPGVSIQRGRNQGRVTGAPEAPKLNLALSNESRRFATEYSGSPLHNLLAPGKRCQFGAVIGSDVAVDDELVTVDDPEALVAGTADLPIFTGRTDEPKERYGIGQRTVGVTAYGLMNRLIGVKVTIPLQASITSGAAMALVWEAAGLTADVMVIDADAIANGRHLLNWYAIDRSAWELTREIWATEGPPAAVWEDPHGRGHYEGRNYRTLTARCQVVQQTFADTLLGRLSTAVDDTVAAVDDPRIDLNGESSILWHTDAQYEPSYGTVVNDLSIQVEKRVAQAVQQVWQASGVLTLGSGEVRTIIARSSSGDPLTSIQTPTVTTDFTIGSGSVASISVLALTALDVLITITAGAGGAVLNPVGSNTGLQLRAAPVQVVSTVTVEGTVDASDSRDQFGKHGLPSGLSIWRGLSEAEAAGLIDAYLIAYPEPRALVIVTVENASGSLLREILTREVSDRIHVIDEWSGIDLDVTVEQISHTITTGGRHVAVLVCERVVELDWALYDVARYDVDRYGQ